MTYSVYVLHSPSSGKIYVGYSSNVDERLLSHNQLATKGWTVRFRPWELIHTEVFSSKQLALHRERQLKSARGRQFIREHLIK